MGARSGKHGRVACKFSPHYQAANSTMGGKIFTGESCVEMWFISKALTVYCYPSAGCAGDAIYWTKLVYGAGCGGSRKRRARVEGAETTFRLSPPEKKETKEREHDSAVMDGFI
ncbi:hypothetical protein VCV18_012314 [Metarhizium anisopliae]